MNYVIKKDSLPSFLESLKKDFRVFAPAKNDSGATCFQEYHGQSLCLETRTHFSPKLLFRPYKEKIFSFRKKNSSYDVRPVFDKSKKLVFGVRPCFTHGLNALDELFLRYYGDDQFYSARRKNTVLIALQCNKACENGFCESMGTSQAVGHDLLFFERGQDFFVKPETKAGKELLDKRFFRHTNDGIPSPKINCGTSLKTENLGKNLYQNFEHKAWEKESESCLSCSACTQVCPTCYCYITDDEFAFGSYKESARFRLLDSCQLLGFTKVAGDHVFRESRKARLRQFVLHKLSYYQENHGMQLCVGCGRCITACPAKIDLTKIANTIQRSLKK